jgi:hypothetical protein
VVVPDFEKLEQADRDVFRHPYVFCASYVAGQVFRWVDRHLGPHARVAFVFESGDEGAGLLAEELSPENIGGDLGQRVSSVAFASNRRVMALQAADMVTYEYAKVVPRRLGSESLPTRKLLQLLTETFPMHGAYFALRGLRDFADENRLIRSVQAAIERGLPESEVSSMIREHWESRGGKTGWTDIFNPSREGSE